MPSGGLGRSGDRDPQCQGEEIPRAPFGKGGGRTKQTGWGHRIGSAQDGVLQSSIRNTMGRFQGDLWCRKRIASKARSSSHWPPRSPCPAAAPSRAGSGALMGAVTGAALGSFCANAGRAWCPDRSRRRRARCLPLRPAPQGQYRLTRASRASRLPMPAIAAL